MLRLRLLLPLGLVAALSLSGCNALLGVLLAPESVVASTAAALTMQVGSAASSALNEADGLARTIGDLDRVIAANPDSANAEHLRGLRSDLQGQLAGTQPGGKPKSAPRPPPPSEFDRRLGAAADGPTPYWKPGPGGIQRATASGDRLVVERPAPRGGPEALARDARDPQAARFAGAQPGSLQPPPPRVYSGDNTAVRLRPLESYTPSTSEVRRPDP